MSELSSNLAAIAAIPATQSLPSRNQILLAAAEACLAEGWAIIPLDPTGKSPYSFTLNEQGFVSRWQNGVHSVYSASFGPPREYIAPKSGKAKTTTPALQAWWDGHECNPAVALELSDLTVLDIDEGVDSENELKEFLVAFNIPVSRTIQSGRTSAFGAHVYFKGRMASGSFVIPWKSKSVKGEVKSQHKYVAAEGSFHKSGQQYRRLWDIPRESTPVELFTEILEKYAPTKAVSSAPISSVPFDGKATTQEQIEKFFEEYHEDYVYNGWNKAKKAHQYIRVDGCPWSDLHTTGNGNNDFAVFVGDGPLSVKCVHETCKAGWTESSGWKSYRAWLEDKHKKSVPLQSSGKVTVGPKSKAGILPNESSVSEAPMTETPNPIETQVPDKLSKLLTRAMRRSLADAHTDDLIAGWIATQTYNILIGMSSLGKSPLMVQASLCVAFGVPFLGQAVKRGRVLYMDYENGDGLMEMEDALLKHLGIETSDKELDDWYRVIDYPSKEEFEAVIAEFKPTLVVIDSLRGYDRKAETTEGGPQFLHEINQFCRAYGCAFVVIHHPRKAELNIPSKADDLLTEPVMAWCERASGYHGLVQQAYTRIGVIKSPPGKDECLQQEDCQGELILRGNRKGIGDCIGPLYLGRSYDEDGEILGYFRLTGNKMLKGSDAMDITKIPEGKAFHLGDMAKLFPKKDNRALRRMLERMVNAGVIHPDGKKKSKHRTYTRLAEGEKQ